MRLLSNHSYPKRSLAKDGLVAGGQNTDLSLPEAETVPDIECWSLACESRLERSLVQPSYATINNQFLFSLVECTNLTCWQLIGSSTSRNSTSSHFLGDGFWSNEIPKQLTSHLFVYLFCWLVIRFRFMTKRGSSSKPE